ncbi:uncharacterized protein LOC121264574 [Juglans microcarpa x Juglans regia]|uniref:uncharacterized protein LOC121264574 n=1 Tax=Juglans microcarpa x Juglans regia TaxID=2249226 RepID=UPI001B7EA592|nr:uncharacterized protein LOC121264574 [Juglans microcarpa x Juglans regia]
MLMIKHIVDEVLAFLSVVVGLMMISCLLGTNILASATVPRDEVDALQQIAETMGATDWKFNANTCQVETVMSGPPPSLPRRKLVAIANSRTIPATSYTCMLS